MTIIQEIDVEELIPIFSIPENMRNRRVEVTIRPVEKETQLSTLERIEQFRKKYNHETFIENLKKQLSEGYLFDFDAQKVVNGTETEEEKQARYRTEKQTWGNAIQKKNQVIEI